MKKLLYSINSHLHFAVKKIQIYGLYIFKIIADLIIQILKYIVIPFILVIVYISLIVTIDYYFLYFFNYSIIPVRYKNLLFLIKYIFILAVT